MGSGAKSAGKKKLLIGVFIALMAFQGILHKVAIYPAWDKNYNPKVAGVESTLSPDQLLFALAGFREMVAGILWVRADSFFETGNYDAVLPLLRLVTWLDPHQIDVYSTGMWHIAYNFTDEDQRSDRRYVPSALALGKEGTRQNPNTYELFFEEGWLWYHKIDDDYHQAVKWFEEAHKRPDVEQGRKNLLSNAMQRNGQLLDALDLYFRLYDETDKEYQRTQEFGAFQLRETIENNIDTMIVRMVQRGWLAGQRKDPIADYDTQPPFDVGFSARVVVEEPAIIRVQGTWNVLSIGTRIRLVLRDANDPNGIPAGLLWDSKDTVDLEPPAGVTFMQDQLFVKNRKFNKRIDMSKDRTMYPFSRNSDKYYVEFYFNPRSAAPHMQDKFGYLGEGLTDANFLNTEVRPGQRVMYAKMELTRDQILRKGEWQDKVPAIQTPNFQAEKVVRSEDDVILIPSLRSEGR